MKKAITRSLLAVAAFGVAGAAFAQLKPEEMIQIRQAGYKFMSWNMGKIKAQAVDGTVPFNKDQVLAASLAIKGIANSGMGALFAPGTEKSIGNVRTRVLPDFFDPKKADERNKIAQDYIQAANKLAEVAATGDQGAIKAQFGDLGKACKACHDKFREEEKK